MKHTSLAFFNTPLEYISWPATVTRLMFEKQVTACRPGTSSRHIYLTLGRGDVACRVARAVSRKNLQPTYQGCGVGQWGCRSCLCRVQPFNRWRALAV